MADEIKETVEKSGGKSFLLIIIIVILVLLLVVGGLLAFLLMGGDEQNANAQPQAQQAAPMQQAHQPGKRSVDYMNMGVIYPLDAFTVNLLSENGSRYLKTKMGLEQNTEALTAELDKKKDLLRDIIIRTLSSKTYEEISTIKGKDRLKDEIVSKINEVLSDGYIKNIFFTDFVVQ